MSLETVMRHAAAFERFTPRSLDVFYGLPEGQALRHCEELVRSGLLRRRVVKGDVWYEDVFRPKTPSMPTLPLQDLELAHYIQQRIVRRINHRGA